MVSKIFIVFLLFSYSSEGDNFTSSSSFFLSSTLLGSLSFSSAISSISLISSILFSLFSLFVSESVLIILLFLSMLLSASFSFSSFSPSFSFSFSSFLFILLLSFIIVFFLSNNRFLVSIWLELISSLLFL